MLYRNLDEFLQSIPKDKRLMCLDMGEKQIGIAFSDKTQLIATAHSIYYRRNMSKDLGYLNRVLKENEAGSMVIGLPFTIDDQETEWCKAIIQFANKIIKKCKINIYLQDESLSTSLATHALKITEISITKSKKIDDKIAACIILQRTLDKINTIK
ncbi:Holliday junction resolvase RuvX [Wolbachia endosymbiont of Diaphorina citri]|jgi:RNAse H-fold protein YqgF|uniref:Holliday junction resolvase RuvX n=1 Tax=Wolbachia endosymbiont of Diaphorina citri TaxID=116598 RepID=UPI0004764D72|nr:Holliday junction resolvase RuvX [Wolbachia endosymbiont of Diaphorina citri]QJT94180.1 Holliday junction resolvase RuvX [Wolbachia endosymbiont of Diaphorina citri]QJT95421.1 Holliday junction resolvase RuvX [Wolbachia endosymbiont of Diaphorina citri]QJT96782.1 Holliday junction resolvase RuvX [Wolbachia endosymbiont of Diaphorina citri]QLK11077.1 Holliday junction resolvase RuvX [Wolbachia endosymbiont of Diaphorina citri]QXY87391.1 Holliday junction resolvase RuvX [Wolbachia endosymbion